MKATAISMGIIALTTALTISHALIPQDEVKVQRGFVTVDNHEDLGDLDAADAGANAQLYDFDFDDGEYEQAKLEPRWPPERFPCPAEKCWRICIRPWATQQKGKFPRERGKCKAKCARHCHEPLKWDGDRIWPNLEKELEE